MLYLAFLKNSIFCVVRLKRSPLHFFAAEPDIDKIFELWQSPCCHPFGGPIQYPRPVTQAKQIVFLQPFTPIAKNHYLPRIFKLYAINLPFYF